MQGVISMTKREVAELMTIMQANYPDSFRGQSDAVVGAKIALWHDFFKDYHKELVHAAAKAFMANDTKGFMPNVGQINDQIQKLVAPVRITEGEAWAMVYKALINSSYNSAEEFGKLPENIQRLVGSPNQLREWARLDLNEVQTVVASNFQRTYRTRAKADAEYDKLPGEVKEFAKKIAGQVFGRLDPVPARALEESYENYD